MPAYPTFALLVAVGLALPGAPAPAAAPKGKTVHGAIAVNRDTQVFGYAYDARTATDARREALKQCGEKKCEVLTSFKNGCAAVASAQRKLVSMTGTTRDEAETKVLRKCGAECKVLAWACTR